MKNIVSILAVVAATATASGAAAQSASFDPADVKWVGSAVELADGCVFTKNEDGEMSYAENADDLGGVWAVTKRAKLNVSVRGAATKLSIVADEHIVRVDGDDADLTSRGHTKYSVNVDYAEGAFPTQIKRSYNIPNEASAMQAVIDAKYTTGVKGTFGAVELKNYMMGKHMEFKLGGEATMQNPNALIDNGVYELGHTATCLQ